MTPISLHLYHFVVFIFSDFLGLIQNTFKVPLNWYNDKTVSPSTTFDLFVANNELLIQLQLSH
jgi:hypothetical protein